MSDTMVHLLSDGEYGQVYQKVEAFLAQHFTRLPRVDLYYDEQGVTRSETQRHQIVTGGLVVVRMSNGDAIGVLVNDQVELDAVSASCGPELRELYGYHE